jgi:hemerythrin-like metal-binding protein
MSLIEWKDEFNTGIADIDHEHEELIGLINELYRRVSEGESKMTVLDFLGEIDAKISAHFALEERIMRDKHYDEYQDHKADHERLLEEIRDIMDDCEDNAQFDREAFAQRLSAWFTNHFKTQDARLHKHLG